MKKTITLLFTLFWISISLLYARTTQEAAELARQFLAERERSHPSAQRIPQTRPQTVEWSFTQYQLDATTPAVYIFNTGEDDGFVLVSAEEQARTILGYADNGSFDASNIPANMQFWLQMYADELARISDSPSPLSAGQSTIQRPQRIVAASNEYPTIAPIIGDVHWGQDKPFNNLCPTIFNKKTPTGCVATAIGQIMYHHKHPTRGIGSRSYKTQTHQISLSADFGATTYDWENMLPNYAGSYTTTQANAVATLLSHVGIASDMDYTSNGSGANSATALQALMKHFDYDKAINTMPKDYISESEIIQSIASDLQLGHPVLFRGTTVNNEGHAFVCDGLQSNGYLHINWGWDGNADGYFAISALDPEEHGTGGSASELAFTQEVAAYTGIQPNQGGSGMGLVTVDAIKRTSADQIGRTSKIEIQLSKFFNQGLATAQGTIACLIYNDQQQLIETIDYTNFELQSYYYYTSSIDVWAIPSAHLANGDYELEIAYYDYNDQYQPIYVKNKGIVRIPFTLTTSQIIFEETEQPEVAHIAVADIIHTDGTTQWNLDLFSPNFWGNTPSDSETIIRCTIHSDSQTSLVGTYVLDDTNSGEIGTIQADALYAIGYAQACYQYTPDKLHLTITEDDNGTLMVQYYMEVNGEVHQQTRTVTPTWYLHKDGSYYYYDEYITYDLAAAISTSRAVNAIQTLAHTDKTQMAYFVDGIISNMRNTPSEIAYFGTARFDISDNGSTQQQLYCSNIRWLNNDIFTTGHEIALGNEVVIYGPVQYYNGKTPEISGYVYAIDQDEDPTDYSIQQLKLVNIYDMEVTFEWVSNAPMVEVSIYDHDNHLLGKTHTANTQPSFTAPAEGIYTICVQPVNEQHQYLAEAVSLEVEVVDYAISDLKVTTEGTRMYASWSSPAPYFHAQLLAADGTTIVNQIIDFSSLYIDLEEGTYTFWIRPTDAAQEYYVSDAVEQTFTIGGAPTDVEDLHSNTTIYLYDLMGRLIDSQCASDQRPWNIPHSGIYILQTEHRTEKVYMRREEAIRR